MNHARRFGPLAVFVFVPSFLILPILFSGKMLYGHDVVSVFHYQRIVIAEAFREGRLPVWDPHVMAGFPLLAAVQGAVFYPPTWLCVVMSAGTFWTLSAWAHLILAGVFAHRWLERGLGVGPWAALAGAFVFMMSGYIVGHLYAGHVNYVWAYPWMAALLWRLERFLAGPALKRGVLLAVVLAMLFLAGVPQFVFFAGLLVLARGLHFILSEREGRKERAKVAGEGVAWLGLGLLLCAPQLCPTLELISQMQRGSSEDQEFLTQHSVAGKQLIDLVIPRSRESRYWWETGAFIGGAALLLIVAAFARKHQQRSLWFGTALVAVLLAMGTRLPFYEGFVAVVPGASLFRAPGRYLLLFTLAATALVGLGFERLWSMPDLRFRLPAAVLAVGAAGQLTDFGSKCILPHEPRSQSVPPWSPEKVSRVRELAGLERRIATGWPPEAQAAGLDHIGGYEPMLLRRYAEAMNAARGAPIEEHFVILYRVGRHRIIEMLGANQIFLEVTDQVPDWGSEPMPRAWVVNNAVVLESRKERLEIMAKGLWDPRKSVILEQYPTEAPPVTTEGPAGRAKVVSRRPGEYLLEAENPADAYLVLSEAYYPGWSAEVDGKPAEVLPANHLIQAIRLPPGRHVVRFAYRSRFLGVGFAVAVLAALVPVAMVLVRRRRG